ncbi:MAG: hypothetical protein NXH83_02885 [Rhodobacteraceae bacterium]|nr:hypothetical protein [Paracoccaceae bacterium]
MSRLAPLALCLALAACDWPVPEVIGAQETPPGPWPRLAPDAILGIGAGTDDAGDEPEDALPDPADLAARAEALRERALALAAR